MSIPTDFPLNRTQSFIRTRTRTRIRATTRLALALLTTVLLTVVGNARTARADELTLHGPHPFLKENAVSIAYLMGTAFGDSFNGQGIGVTYGYMIEKQLWLDLQINFRGSTCPPWGKSCAAHTGNAAEVMPGISWRFPTDLPLVPFVRGNAGLLFLYPDGAQNAIGLGIRAGGGVKYYLFDWLGFGLESALSLGHGFYSSAYPAGHGYAVLDVGAAIELQFP